MTTPTRARTLKIRPIQSCDLAFNMSGVIDRHNASWQIGDVVHALDLDKLYRQLETELVDGALKFNAEAIDDYLRTEGDKWLFSLRAVSVAASLERMILQRQIAHLQTYKHAQVIASKYKDLYPTPTTPSSKIGRLTSLGQHVDTRHQELKQAYSDAGRTGVVEDTQSVQTALTASEGSSSSTEQTESVSASKSDGETQSTSTASDNSISRESGTSVSAVKTLPIGTDSVGDVGESTYQEKPLVYDGNDWNIYQAQSPDLTTQKTDGSSTSSVESLGSSASEVRSHSSSFGTTSSTAQSSSTGTSLNNARTSSTAVAGLAEFLHPFEENEIKLQRRHLDLQDERVSHELLALRVPHLEAILANEQRLLDLEIKQLQLNYIHSFLFPPFSGIITGVYKDRGEHVEAGEPVVRIENGEEVFVVGRINYRGRLDIGMKVDITATNAFESGVAVTLTGKVVAVRGHDADDDEWDVIFRCDNRDDNDAKKRKFPLNYSFDYHAVELVITQ